MKPCCMTPAGAVFSLLLVLLFASPLQAQGPLPVTVSILPQKYFVERIGGERVDVSVMVAPGASPATYEPKPKQMVAVARCRVYFAIGVPFESVWLARIAAANPEMLMVHTESGIEKIPMGIGHHHDDEHGSHQHAAHEAPPGREGPRTAPGGPHPHTPPAAGTGPETHHHEEHPYADHQHHHRGVMDPHIWLAPNLVKVQAGHIRDALVQVDPPHRAEFEANYESFLRELADLDREIREMLLEKGKGTRFMVFHPAWGYFAQAYGLEQIPIETEGKEPKPADLQRLIAEAREAGIKAIFVQPQFSKMSAETIASAIDAEVVAADPLAPDWAANLRRVAEALSGALK